jgi:hypothetical protein
MQDLDSYGGPPPQIQEGIPDTYTVLAESTVPAPGSESEADGHAASAMPISIERPWSAAIGLTLPPRALGASEQRR